MSNEQSVWWNPHTHADRRPLLLMRNQLVAAVRTFYAERGFLEVECAAMQVSPGNETHLHAFAVQGAAQKAGVAPFYLHTSPEFACKKFLAAGEPAIFTFAKVYRDRESNSRLHTHEFTMLEWYRAREPYETLMHDCVDLVRTAALTAGARELIYGERWADPLATPDYLTVSHAFRLHAGFDVLASVAADGTGDRDMLAQMTLASGIACADDDTWSDIFSRVISERIEPQLGQGRLTLLYEYPVIEAALAQACPHDCRVAERFELYACGVELANGFGELTDPVEQRARFEADMDLKEKIYNERYPLDEELLSAIGIMPPASGVALGFDRLVMLLTGAPTINHVIWTPPAVQQEQQETPS